MAELYPDQLNWNRWGWGLLSVYFYISSSLGCNVHQVEDNC